MVKVTTKWYKLRMSLKAGKIYSGLIVCKFVEIQWYIEQKRVGRCSVPDFYSILHIASIANKPYFKMLQNKTY